jgi:serine/threonine protein kinase/type II secretory pathway pseudopilin PulG
MTPERWQQIKEIFDQAIECETGQRDGFLTTACGGDADLRAEVENLLKGHAQASGFIERPVVNHAVQLPEKPTLDPMVGLKVGHYQLLRELGHGGMGQVYLAVRADDEYKKRVAFKALKRGMDTRDIRRRFRRERQILAGLDHPNIAKLLDGGTTDDGLPYFVMEYVEGKPITEYCDSRKLPTVERLKLFRQVCAAVQFAHQNLVVHRDIKPSNILVTEDGAPKLLDFGIAKLLNPELSGQTIDPTATALRLMTPEYASPEQVRGETITTASDVYSLGVVLYELLTGHRPYRVKSRAPHEIIRIVCEEEPDKPSTAVNRVDTQSKADGTTLDITPESVSRTREGEPERLRRRLRGDLDNIVLMAMRKEPQRRYTTVNQLSEDIRRHLEGLPVVARQDTITYRVEKFIQRNRAAAIAAVAVLLALLAGMVATTWQARVASRERARAERRFNDVRQLANTLIFELHDDIETLPGSTPAREKLVKRALQYLDVLAQEASDDLSLQLDLAEAYLKVGKVQYFPLTASLGDVTGALQSYRKALSIIEPLFAQDPNNAAIRRIYALAHKNAGDVLAVSGEAEKAVQHQRKALPIFEALSAADPANQEARIDLARAYISLGDALIATLERNESLDKFYKALATYEVVVATNANNLAARRGLAAAHGRIGNEMEGVGNIAGALEHIRKALAISEELLALERKNTTFARGVAVMSERVGNILANQLKDHNGALGNYRKAMSVYEDLARSDPKNAQAREDEAGMHQTIGAMLAEMKDFTSALNEHRKAQSLYESLAAASPASAEAQLNLVSVHSAVANTLAKMGNNAQALESYSQAAAVLERFAAAQPNTDVRHNLAWTLHALGTFQAKLGKQIEARSALARALSLFRERADRAGATDGDFNEFAFASSIFEPADLCDPAVALAYAQRAVEANNGRSSYILDTLALAYHRNGDHARAIELVEKARAMLTGSSYRSRTFDADLNKFKAAIHYQKGEYASAIELIKQAIALLGDDETRGPAFAADLTKYQAAAKGKAK